MYRILNPGNVSLQNFKLLRVRKCISKEYHLVLTTRPISNYDLISRINCVKDIGCSIRCSSTTTNPDSIKQTKRKPRSSNYAKYIELLQVSPNATKQIRTKVKNLKSKKLTDFVSKPTSLFGVESSAVQTSQFSTQKTHNQQPVEYQKIDLEIIQDADMHLGMYEQKPLIFIGKSASKTIDIIEKPEKVQNIIESFQQFREIIETIEIGAEEERAESRTTAALLGEVPKTLEEDLEVAENDVLEELQIAPEPITKAKGKVKTKEHKFKSKIHQSIEQQNLAKQKAIVLNLTTYLNICVSNNMLSRGLTTLLSYREKYKRLGSSNNTLSVDLYNILLHGYAGKANFDKIKEICAILNEDRTNYNPQTFAAIFECLGRLEPTEHNRKLLEKFRHKAENMGISLNMIMDRSKFVSDQREIVLDAIQSIEPNFKPQYTPPEVAYSNPLLDKLNENIRDFSTSNNDQPVDNAIMNSKKGFTADELRELAREQLEIELEGSITIKSIEKGKEFGDIKLYRKRLDDLMNTWRSQVIAAVARDLNTLRAQARYKSNSHMTYYNYLKCLDANQYADIILKEIRNLAEGSETYSPTVGQLHRELGRRVHAKYQIELKKRNGILQKMGEVYSEFCEQLEQSNTSDNPRQMWQRIVYNGRESGPSMDICEMTWPSNVMSGVGRFLYNVLMRDIKIDVNIMRNNSKTQNFLPAFYTLFRNQGRLVKEEVKPHPVLARLLRASQQQTLTFDTNLVPMLCPPQPWSTPHNGGYLLIKSDLIRLPHQAVQQWARIDASNPQNLYPALDSLNQLGSIPWTVNRDVLDIALEVFQNGGDEKLDVPQPPSSLPALPTTPSFDKSLTSKERYQLFRQKLIHRRRKAEMYSLWCDALYRLSLANHFRDKIFWLPHNMDFRGRVYPLPPHLNHLGSDLARSLLVFHQAQPLGKDGFSWLKLHCINLTGTKKRDSVRERLLYAESIMDDIIDSADNPLTGRRWWTKSDEPWQTLACCIEIAKVTRCEDPEKFMSRFPIHQDGSCNGLQHYAALGRDKAGAISVNLAPCDAPQDVYSSVAALVEKCRQNDAANGLHVAQILEGYVRRKVIKQTVMTTVYGVTRYGARLQIARQLKDIDEFPKEWVWPASTYLTTKTFESLREMFTSTKEIQDWFTECARLISGVCAQNVEWVTPLGLPIVQPYNRIDCKSNPKNSQKVSEKMHMDMYEKPNIMKQKNAFPPNFIHSLDSSHMMLTSLYCERKGLTFVSVHDCFWTHACTVPDMNKICREQFVALHSQPILENLSKFLAEKYSFSESDFTHDGSVSDLTRRKLNNILLKVPDKGDFDLTNVLNSVYFFS